MKTFHDLNVFQAAIDLMVEVYRATESYPRHELFGLVAQMRRASCSVVSNIAEGQGRSTFGEWRQMLSHARGSLFEVEAQMIASSKLGYLSDEGFTGLKKHRDKTGRLLAGLIRYVRNREHATRNPQQATNEATREPTTPSP